MKILLKILVAPFALALSLLTALLVFLFDICAFLLTIASVILAVLGITLFFTPTPIGGIVFLLFCVLSLVGCGRSMDDIIKNESSITGVVEEVYNNSILISIQTDAYPYGAYCDVSLDAENKDDMVDFNIGDEVIVYYDGNIAESYPLQINTVYAISLKDPAN